MKLLLLLVAALPLTHCVLIQPTRVSPAFGLVIANESEASVFWYVEQPTGEMTRFELQPCGSTSKEIDAGAAWEVEWGATLAVTSDEVRALDAPITVIEVRFAPDGAVDVAPPRAAERRPDAPIDLACVRR